GHDCEGKEKREGSTAHAFILPGTIVPFEQGQALPAGVSSKSDAAGRSEGRRSSLRAPLGPQVGGEDALAQANGAGRDLHELVVVDELQGLLQVQGPERGEAYGLVRRGSPHVGELFRLG